MRIILLAIHYPPLRTSCAVQMKDLALELCRLGHQPIVITPTENLDNIAAHDKIDGIQIFRVKTNKTTNVSFFFRGLNEIFLPFMIINAIRKSNLSLNKLDAVIWYSPTIFFGPVVHFLKKMSGCQTYLILRDIFPEWALDLGVLKKNPIYFFFKIVAKYQYSVANIIGVQSPSNLKYFKSWRKKPKRKLEVLNNWLSPNNQKETKISFTNTDFNRKKLFVYAGNMGIAQGMDIFIELADSLKNRKDLGFIFVGRGSEANKLKKLSVNKKLDNVLFFEEVSPEEIPSLLKMCHVGLVALDLRHKSHNIPGKFLTYLQAELPVLAKINFGNDLQYIIENENVGLVYSGNVVKDLSILATKIIDDEINYKVMSKSCKSLFKKMFSTKKITNQIISSLSENLNK